MLSGSGRFLSPDFVFFSVVVFMVFFLVLCGSVSVFRPSLRKDRVAGRRVGVKDESVIAQVARDAGAQYEIIDLPLEDIFVELSLR